MLAAFWVCASVSQSAAARIRDRQAKTKSKGVTLSHRGENPRALRGHNLLDYLKFSRAHATPSLASLTPTLAAEPSTTAGIFCQGALRHSFRAQA
jgi:hypothetical protein